MWYGFSHVITRSRVIIVFGARSLAREYGLADRIDLPEETKDTKMQPELRDQ